MKVTSKSVALALMTAFLIVPTLSADIIQVSVGAFTAQAGLITFSEKPVNTQNPVYLPAQYGGGATAPTVSFGGFFLGQHLSASPSVDCPGGAATGCVVGTPTGPLSLDPNSPVTFITTDNANPTSPVLSGSPRFNGPVTMLFSTPQVGVGLDGGFFDALHGTGITAFAADGTVIGRVTNSATGIQFLGLITSDNSNTIAGLQFSLVGSEPAGFAIDNLRFGVAGQVINPTPEPGTVVLLLTIVGALGFGLRKKLVSVN